MIHILPGDFSDEVNKISNIWQREDVELNHVGLLYPKGKPFGRVRVRKGQFISLLKPFLLPPNSREKARRLRKKYGEGPFKVLKIVRVRGVETVIIFKNPRGKIYYDNPIFFTLSTRGIF